VATKLPREENRHDAIDLALCKVEGEEEDYTGEEERP